MRIRTRIVAASASAVIAAALFAAGGGTAQAVVGPTISNVRLSTTSVSVDGLNTLPVTFTVTISGAQHVQALSGVAWWYPRLVLQQTVSGGGEIPGMAVSLCPVGDAQPCPTSATILTDGDWTGTIRVPSTAVGTWTVAGVQFTGDIKNPTLAPAPAADPSTTLTVAGFDIPALTVGTSPNPVHYLTAFSFKGMLFNASSSAHGPVNGVVNVGSVLSSTNDECFNGNGHGLHFYYTKKGGGGYTAPIDAAQSLGPVHFCLDVLSGVNAPANSDGLRQIIIRRIAYPNTFTTVGGLWPTVVAKTGTVLIIQGQALPWQVSLSGCQTEIAYLYGRTALRAAGPLSNVRTSGRITMSMTVLKGAHLYKVYLPRCGLGGAWAGSTSRSVTITGT